MSPARADLVFAVAVVLPFALALPALLMGVERRLRRLYAFLYAALAAGFGFALLAGFLLSSRRVRWGSLRLDGFGFPLFLLINLLGAAVVLYAGFRREAGERPGLLLACMSAACGCAGLAVISRGLVQFAVLFESVTVLAFLGLVAGGVTRKSLRGMVGWFASDALFLAGVVLCRVFLEENVVLVQPPLTRGTEVQVVVVVALFLAAALLRLGAFPFGFWMKDVAEGADPAWNALFLGVLNFLLAGGRLCVAAVLMGRLVAGDWGPGLTAWAAVTVVAGSLVAWRARSPGAYVTGLYSLQGGLLLMGLALFSRGGLAASLFILLACPAALAATFMASGTAMTFRGSGGLDEGQGLSARLAPLALVSMVVAGMSLAGAPPLDGFPGRASLIAAALERASVQPAYALAALAVLVAFGLALAAALRVSGMLFDGSEVAGRGSLRPSALESLVPPGLCLVSLLFGLFPGILSANFVDRSSLLLFARGFSGPGVVIKGAGPLVEAAAALYRSWAQSGAAFLLAWILPVLVVYFANRAAHPSEGGPPRFRPFVGGAPGEYSEDRGWWLPGAPARSAGRRRWRG